MGKVKSSPIVVGVLVVAGLVLCITVYNSPGRQPNMAPDREPILIRPPTPRPNVKPPKTKTYKIFDTSKYTDAKGMIIIPSDEVLRTMSLAYLEELYNRYLESLQVICPRMQHIGDEFDGGYHICEPLLSQSSCLAYSFGNNNDYTFDGGLAAIYGCEVHSFDPADGQDDHHHSDLITFHKVGIGGKDETINNNMVIKTVDSVRKMLNHEHRDLDILKIDTEKAEWEAFPQMLQSKTLQRANVKMLIVEFHSVFMKRTVEFYLSALRTLRGIDEAGYKRYYFRMWVYCRITDPATNLERTGCHEVHYMKV